MTMAKIKELPQEEFKFSFTCKRCGSNLHSPTSLANHKFGGPELGFVKMDICGNCFNGSNLRF